MAGEYALKFVTQVWLVAVTMLLGIGPGTACWRRCRLPTCFWLPLTLASACLVAYGLFWIYLCDPRAGRLAAAACLIASVGAFAWQIGSTRGSAAPIGARLAERDAWLPGVLMATLLMAYLFILFARDAPINVRFTWELPSDNVIAELFADRLDRGTPRAEPFMRGLWQTSDRPPLQTAMVLATRPFAPHGGYTMFVYQVIGSICQLGWVPALYALLRQIGASRRQQIYAFLGCACSGFFLLHSLFTWPKLLAAWLFLLAVTLLLRVASPRQGEDAGDAGDAVRLVPIAGVLIALSLLSHGGTAFSLLALPVLWWLLRLRGVVSLRQVTIATMLFAIVMAPWIAYQKFYDPPGDRLLEQHLAGLEDPDPRGLTRAIVDQYATLTPGFWLAGRWANLQTQVRWDPRVPGETRLDWIRRQQFFHQFIALDFLCLGFIGLWRPGHDQLRRLAWFALATILIWCVLMFTPGAAIVHQGSFVATMLLFVAGSIGLAALPRVVGQTVLIAHVAVFVTIWLATDQTSLSRAPMIWKPVQAFAALVFATMFVIVLLLGSGAERPAGRRATADA